jgi:hypothetical protein
MKICFDIVKGFLPASHISRVHKLFWIHSKAVKGQIQNNCRTRTVWGCLLNSDSSAASNDHWILPAKGKVNKHCIASCNKTNLQSFGTSKKKKRVDGKICDVTSSRVALLSNPKSFSKGIKWQPLWSSDQIFWLQIQRSGFDSWRYQIFWEVVGLERGPLSLVSTIEKLLEIKNSGSGLERREYGCRDLWRWPHGTPSIRKSWH